MFCRGNDDSLDILLIDDIHELLVILIDRKTYDSLSCKIRLVSYESNDFILAHRVRPQHLCDTASHDPGSIDKGKLALLLVERHSFPYHLDHDTGDAHHHKSNKVCYRDNAHRWDTHLHTDKDEPVDKSICHIRKCQCHKNPQDVLKRREAKDITVWLEYRERNEAQGNAGYHGISE